MRFPVVVYRNGFKNGGRSIMMCDDFDTFKMMARNALFLPKGRIKIYDMEGAEFFDSDVIFENDKLYISCGEDFIHPESELNLFSCCFLYLEDPRDCYAVDLLESMTKTEFLDYLNEVTHVKKYFKISDDIIDVCYMDSFGIPEEIDIEDRIVALRYIRLETGVEEDEIVPVDPDLPFLISPNFRLRMSERKRRDSLSKMVENTVAATSETQTVQAAKPKSSVARSNFVPKSPSMQFAEEKLFGTGEDGEDGNNEWSRSTKVFEDLKFPEGSEAFKFQESIIDVHKMFDVVSGVVVAHNSKEVISRGLEALVTEHFLKQIFDIYLRSMLAEENLSFILAVEDFKKSPSYDAALGVCNSFIYSGSENEININYHQRKRIEEALGEEPLPADMFDQARSEILTLLKKNFLESFVKSEMFTMLVRFSYEICVKCVSNGEIYATPLHRAVMNNNLGILRSLLDNSKLLVGVTLPDGNTPLHVAASEKSSRIMQLILQYDPTIDSINASGETPLHIAARAEVPENVKLLVDSGADTQICNEDGKVPYHLTKKGSRSMLKGYMVLTMNEPMKALLPGTGVKSMELAVFTKDFYIFFCNTEWSKTLEDIYNGINQIYVEFVNKNSVNIFSKMQEIFNSLMDLFREEEEEYSSYKQLSSKFKEQKGAHKKLEVKLRDCMEQFIKTSLKSTLQFINLIKEWIVHHVLESDMDCQQMIEKARVADSFAVIS